MNIDPAQNRRSLLGREYTAVKFENICNILINLHVLPQPRSLHQLLEVGSDVNKLICQVYITPV